MTMTVIMLMIVIMNLCFLKMDMKFLCFFFGSNNIAGGGGFGGFL